MYFNDNNLPLQGQHTGDGRDAGHGRPHGGQAPVGGGHRALPAGRRRHLGGDHPQGGGHVRGAPGTLLEDRPPSTKGDAEGDATSGDRMYEDEVSNLEDEVDAGEKDQTAGREPGQGDP